METVAQKPFHPLQASAWIANNKDELSQDNSGQQESTNSGQARHWPALSGVSGGMKHKGCRKVFLEEVMAFVHYVTDNPYRLLDVGSSTSYKDLRQKAGAAAQAAKVGLAPEAGLEKLFGAEEMPRCADIVYAIANDSRKRTIYRLFWPFDYERPPDASGTLVDIDHLLSACSSDGSFRATHLRFLRAWLDRETEPDAVRLAFDSFVDLYNDEACDDFLARLLQDEGDGNEDACDYVYNAQEEVISHLLTSTCQQAAEQWEAGNAPKAISLLQAVCGSRFQDDQIDRALRAIVDPGGRSMSWLRSLIHAFEDWSPTSSSPDLEETYRLLQLANLVVDRVPEARQWTEVAEGRISQVAYSMRSYAIDLANDRSDYDGSREILLQVQRLLLPPELREKIEDDINRLQQISEDRRCFESVHPIDSAPTLGTFNTVGFTLYGCSPFPARSGWYFATYYFVILFLPLIPIARYLVSDAPGGGWYFHGRTPLTKGSKYHLLGVLAVVLCLMFLNGLGGPDTMSLRGEASSATPLSRPVAASPKPSLETRTSKARQPAAAKETATLSKEQTRRSRPEQGPADLTLDEI
jgi:hypothetical protein